MEFLWIMNCFITWSVIFQKLLFTATWEKRLIMYCNSLLTYYTTEILSLNWIFNFERKSYKSGKFCVFLIGSLRSESKVVQLVEYFKNNVQVTLCFLLPAGFDLPVSRASWVRDYGTILWVICLDLYHVVLEVSGVAQLNAIFLKLTLENMVYDAFVSQQFVSNNNPYNNFSPSQIVRHSSQYFAYSYRSLDSIPSHWPLCTNGQSFGTSVTFFFSLPIVLTFW